MKRIIFLIAIITMLVIFSASTFLAFQKLRIYHEADFAIQGGMALAISQYPFTTEFASESDFKTEAAKLIDFKNKVATLIKEDADIYVARDKAIRLGNTAGLDKLVAKTVCEHFNLKQPVKYPVLVQGPVAELATNIWIALDALSVGLANIFPMLLLLNIVQLARKPQLSPVPVNLPPRGL